MYYKINEGCTLIREKSRRSLISSVLNYNDINPEYKKQKKIFLTIAFFQKKKKKISGKSNTHNMSNKRMLGCNPHGELYGPNMIVCTYRLVGRKWQRKNAESHLFFPYFSNEISNSQALRPLRHNILRFLSMCDILHSSNAANDVKLPE